MGLSKPKNKITKTPTKDSPKKESLVVKGNKLETIKPLVAKRGKEILGRKPIEEEIDLVGNKTREEWIEPGLGKKDKLNQKQEFFCKLYATDRQFFGNGAKSYAEAYDVDLTKKGGYNIAQAAASRMLLNVKILKRINEYLDTEGFNAENVDRQHLFLINQDADLKVKMSAIKEFNALKKRVDNSLTLNIKDLLSKYGSDDDD